MKPYKSAMIQPEEDLPRCKCGSLSLVNKIKGKREGGHYSLGGTLFTSE